MKNLLEKVIGKQAILKVTRFAFIGSSATGVEGQLQSDIAELDRVFARCPIEALSPRLVRTIETQLDDFDRCDVNIAVSVVGLVGEVSSQLLVHPS